MRFSSLIVLMLGLLMGSGGVVATEVTRFHVHDKLSSSSLILDEVGNVAAQERLESFGGVDSTTRAQDEWQYSYHGKQRHTSHGLVDFGARFYDPEIGRFLSMDPRGFRVESPESFNRYAFANNNPYRYTDPDGRVVETAWDLSSVGIGLASLSANLSNGDWGAAALDTVGIALDVAASAVPVVPGGVSAAIAASRATDAAVAATTANNVTKGADSTLSRSGAFKEAKQKAGVPRSQQPDKVYREKIRDQEGHVEGRVYEFERQDGSTATIREHSLGHKLDNHGPHFNSEVRDPTGIKQPLGGNGDSHTYFNR